MPLAVYLGFEIDMDQALTLAAILLVLSFGVRYSRCEPCSVAGRRITEANRSLAHPRQGRTSPVRRLGERRIC